MAEKALTCTLCGGTDFTKEAGYYYCNECQTQSQEVQEQVFENEVEEAQPTTSKRTHTKRIRTKKKDEDQLTSWECYNYIVLGLVNELIEFGAKDTLKETVRILWLKYLHKLEVLSDALHSIPKLGACYSKLDAEILYGKPAKRKKVRSRTPSPSVSDSINDSASLRRHRTKSKRSLILAEYDELSTRLKTQETSLHNRTLTSLSDTSETPAKQIQLLFNKSATKEILKSVSRNHFKKHCQDLNSLLDCHNFTYRKLTEKYLKGPEMLTRKRIYALLYLGLLINKDKIQLGDMLRFIREGFISYDNVNHFFPDDYTDKNLSIKSWTSRSSLLTHKGIRMTAAKIAKFVGVTKYIPKQNLIELCQRYCSELNLPDEAWGFTLNLLSRVPPRMRFTKDFNEIPNYEGRALSMILFTIKLMFGLDDCTEEYFSTYAERINALNGERMFVWNDWTHYIIYRKMVLIQHHFPTQHAIDDDNIQHCDEFVSFIMDQNLKYNKEATDSNHVAEVLRGLLEKLKNKQDDNSTELIFTPTLKPFRDYIQTLLNSNIPHENNYLIDVLESDFKKYSLGFLTNPYIYIDQVHKNKRIGVKHRGANKNLSLLKIENNKKERENWRSRAKQKHYVHVVRKPDKARSNGKEIDSELDTKTILKHFEQCHMHSYKKRMSHMVQQFNKHKQKLEGEEQRSCNKHNNQTWTNGIHKDTMKFFSEAISQSSLDQEVSTEDNCYIHYNAHERFWLRSQNVSEINKDDFMAFFQKFPESFKLIFNECARISEQNLKEYFEEYNNVEIYLCYGTSFASGDTVPDKIYDVELNNLIRRAIKKW